MKLYYAPGACSLASHIVACEGGLKLALEKVDLKEHRTESGKDFYDVNPKGYVPALALDDGSVLTENVALLTYLGDTADLTPKGMERYRLLEWLAFITSEIHKSFGPLFQGAPGDAPQKAREKIIKRLGFIEERLTGDYLMGAALVREDGHRHRRPAPAGRLQGAHGRPPRRPRRPDGGRHRLTCGMITRCAAVPQRPVSSSASAALP